MCSDTSVWLVQVNVHWVRQLTNCTFSCTHRSLESLPNYMHTSGACKSAVTRESEVCMCMCIESYAWLTPHLMHISVTRLTPHLHEHIGQSDQCTFICTHQVHVNVQWRRVHVNVQGVRQLAHCTFSCTHRSLGPLPIYMNASDSRITAHLQGHIRCM